MKHTLNLNEVGDNNEWKKAIWLDSAYSYRIYLRKYPNGIHEVEAKEKIKEIENKLTVHEDTEYERLASIEADKIEAARIAKLKADEEAERLASIEADKIEAARIAKLKADELNARIERERLAKIEVDRIAKLKADENKPQPQTIYTITATQKNRLPIYMYIGGGVLAVLIFGVLYLLPGGNTTPSITVTTPTQQTNNSGQVQQNNYPAATQPVQEYKSETPATQPPKKDNDAQANVDKLARQKQKDAEAARIAKQRTQDNADEAAAAQAQPEQNKNSQIQADKANAKKYLKSAASYISAGEKEYAISDLSKAYDLSNISATSKKFIKSAISYIRADELTLAKSDVFSAIDANY